MADQPLVRNIPKLRQFTLNQPRYTSGAPITKVTVVGSTKASILVRPVDLPGQPQEKTQEVEVFSDFIAHLSRVGTVIQFNDVFVATSYILPKNSGVGAIGRDPNKVYKVKKKST